MASVLNTFVTPMQLDLEHYLKDIHDWFWTSGIRAILIIIVTLILLKVAGTLTRKIAAWMENKHKDIESKKRASTLSGVVRWTLRITVIAVATMMVLEEFHVDIKPVLAAAGVVGVALGFGAQNLVQDFLSGFFILIEDQIRVGDVVQINDKSGLVEQINLRMVILRDAAGNAIFIRNGKIDIVTNMTKDFSRYVFDVNVAYKSDVDEVIAVLKSIDEEMRKDPAFKDDIIAPLEVLGLDSFGESSIVLKARTTTKPIQQWRVGREFNRRMKKKFDEMGIEMPFPHRTVFMGKDHKDEASVSNIKKQA